MKIIDLQEDSSLQMYKNASTKDFWAKHVLNKYMNFKTLVIQLAIMFGSTYICETLFFKMAFLMNKYRSRLTDLHIENILRISCSPKVPNFRKLAQNKKCYLFY